MNKSWVILLSVGLTIGIAVVLQDFPFIKNLLPEQPITEILLVTPLQEKPKAKVLQSGKIDEHLTIDNTLRDIDICGTTYQVKQIFIDEVDVLQRISELLQNSELAPENKVAREFSLSFCKNTSFSLPKELEIGEIPIYAYDSPPEQINEENKTYGIFVSIFFIAVRPSINQIYYVSAYDDTHTPLISLK
jgi:hypothetical protein